jgi:hypothetical protein
MALTLENLFVFELTRQCQFTVLAWEDMQRHMQNAEGDRFWYSVQNFLIATGNISKVLWPSDKSSQGRGAQLRQLFQVPATSPLEPRNFRNHFEHFDERLETWFSSVGSSQFVDSNIAPAGSIVGPRPTAYLRNYDPTAQILSFRGDTYHFLTVVQAVTQLRAEVEKVHQKIFLKMMGIDPADPRGAELAKLLKPT